MKFKFIVLAALALTTFTACSNTAKDDTAQQSSEQTTAAQMTDEPNSQSQPNTVRPVLPSFKLTAMDGSTINLANLKGRKVFVNLWATWCPPCRAEIPSIEALSNKVDKQKVAFVMLSLDQNFELAKQFAIKNRLQLPVFYPAEELPDIFKVDGIPATFIFNDKGELSKANYGMDDYSTNEYLQMLK